jgi:uncharacterized protein
MELTVTTVVVAALATLVGATIQGSIGFGMNLVTVPALALTAPESLPVAVIVLGLPISIAMLRHERADVDRAGIAWIVLGRVPGTVAGAWIVATVSTSTLQLLVGLVLLAVVLTSFVAPPIPVVPATQAVTGAVSGVTGTAAGIGGPPLAVLYQRHTGPAIRATLSASFLIGTILSLGTLAASGSVRTGQLALGAGLTPLVLAGVVLGRRAHRVLDQGWMRPAVLVFAAVSAVAVVVDSVV